MGYLVPSEYGEAELIEKRSRFIGQVWPVTAEVDARDMIAQTRAKYHDARHHCWCYILRAGGIVRYADDGEPQGTAGQTMLEVFRRQGIENVLCVVTRYFGGILLGAGGLTRAYAGTAKLALDAAGVSEMTRRVTFTLVCPYAMFDRVRNEIDLHGGSVENSEYGADVTVTAAFAPEDAEAFAHRITDMTGGTVEAVHAGETYVPVKVK